MRHEYFSDVKDMLVDVVEELEVWGNKVRIALISFADNAHLEFGLDTFSSKQNIEVQLRRILQASLTV